MRSSITGSRDQILVDMTAAMMSEAIRTVVRLEKDGIDSAEAIRMVVGALTELTVTEDELARRLLEERSRPEAKEPPDDRELGGQG
jgi:hypothetical protein